MGLDGIYLVYYIIGILKNQLKIVSQKIFAVGDPSEAHDTPLIIGRDGGSTQGRWMPGLPDDALVA